MNCSTSDVPPMVSQRGTAVGVYWSPSAARFATLLASGRRPLCLLMLVASLLVGCASDPPRNATTYTVRSGDTLYSIAWRHGLDYRKLAQANGIGRDYAITPGQVLRLSGRKAVTAPAKPTTPAKTAPIPAASAVNWLWPVRSGTVTRTTRPNGGQGLMIAGTVGDAVQAAAAGRVVYTGTGLLGYGQLVIVQHNETYLSAYGHTRTVLIREQDTVKAGQTIATMGAGPNGAPALYFEIRINGRPTDPTALLPPR
jgi:lipoprotein NlpD